ncbi:MAG: hypothetical protein GEV28_31110 [Actinophytocola sp.]|uniref:hypothetical protein n=1 Tax=Actinophytocola sp. TaxID=1872138 RepID=UPI0013290682|nr:hypothetical protein [Actinophytocola sp.]MPZ84596.1 hypothetical protein [Actinophytocola sp.]
MRTLRKLFKAPLGFNADGRILGLGLAAAMAKQRQEATRGVEDYLRRSAVGDTDGDRSVTSTTA